MLFRSQHDLTLFKRAFAIMQAGTVTEDASEIRQYAILNNLVTHCESAKHWGLLPTDLKTDTRVDVKSHVPIKLFLNVFFTPICFDFLSYLNEQGVAISNQFVIIAQSVRTTHDLELYKRAFAIMQAGAAAEDADVRRQYTVLKNIMAHCESATNWGLLPGSSTDTGLDAKAKDRKSVV